MDIHDLTRSLNAQNNSKIVLVVADGLGGIPREPGGRTELETAATPNLDSLVESNVCGLMTAVLPGVTPGSGPGHLALFGYDPLEYVIGRGVLEALGIGFELGSNDVAARGNFCTVDERQLITDRRAGRISTETCVRLADKLRGIRIEGVEVFVEPVREYRFAVIFRGERLDGDVNDTDPQRVGARPLVPSARSPSSKRTAEVAHEFIQQAAELLKDESPANMLTLRGFARRPAIPSMSEVYGLNCAAIAVYPMYRGLARLVGMHVPGDASNLEEQLAQVAEDWDRFDFFFVHFKYTDSRGEDGQFDEKVRQIEQLDAWIPDIVSLKPDVLIVTGDHSTPSRLCEHSWHPSPVVLASSTCRPDSVNAFGESDCLRGGLGHFEARYLLVLALAHARRLSKFGA
jgi:2,3-bisphosphoglycerate-independent phosphoglycerate mutase